MRLRRHDYLLQQSIKSCCARKYQPTHTRRYASTSQPQEVAVLGGGITGLTTAYYLSKGPNPPRVTIYEASPRIGGWLNSKFVDVPGGKVLFEQGPRSLRVNAPRGWNTVALLDEIGLAEDILYVPKDSPSAQLRWLYYPDHLFSLPEPRQGLIRAIPKMLTEPGLRGILWDLCTEILKDSRADTVEDESIGDFISRRVSKKLVDNVVSAIFHGVYAGDVWQLSAKSLMNQLWTVEKEDSSIVLGIPHLMGMVSEDDAKLGSYLALSNQPSIELRERLMGTSVITLKNGLQQISERLESVLMMSGNVSFKAGTAVKQISYSEKEEKIKLTADQDTEPSTYDQVISTLFSKTLSKLCTSPSVSTSSSTSGQSLLPTLAQTHAVTVNVVNLYYSDPSTLPIQGFGYLIPRSVPFENNPEYALGVVFDSEISTEQDTVPGTKLTVMLGGHWWDDWDTVPDKEKSIAMAKSVLRRHLGIGAEPTAVHFSSQRECIPQYTVGHSKRLKEAHRALLRHYKGRLKVAGNSYTGVGVNDCLVAALFVAESAKSPDWKGKTGLEGFENDVRYVKLVKRMVGVVMEEEKRN